MESVGAWKRDLLLDHPAGRAGACADSARATYVRGDARIDVYITDMIRVCTGRPGTGAGMVRAAVSGGGGTKAVSVAKHPGVLAGGHLPALTIWIADRCQMTAQVSAGNVLPEDALALAERLISPALARVCAARQ